jgi:hypothetical protein
VEEDAVACAREVLDELVKPERRCARFVSEPQGRGGRFGRVGGWVSDPNGKGSISAPTKMFEHINFKLKHGFMLQRVNSSTKG